MADKTYIVKTGIDFPPLVRKEAGETVKQSELPKESVKWLLDDGVIEPAKGKDKDK